VKLSLMCFGRRRSSVPCSGILGAFVVELEGMLSGDGEGSQGVGRVRIASGEGCDVGIPDDSAQQRQ